MTKKIFSLPGTGYPQLEDIIKAYYSKDDYVSIQYISTISRINNTNISKTHKFLIQCGILENINKTHKLTVYGKKMGKALTSDQRETASLLWRDAIERVEFFQTLLSGIRKQSPVKLQDLSSLIGIISGIDTSKKATGFRVKAKTIIDILERAKYIKILYRGRNRFAYILPDNTQQNEIDLATSLRHLLHPNIVKSSFVQYSNGLYRDAILNAFVAVFELIRQRTKLDLDGSPLAQAVFSTNSPKLIITNLETESGKNEQVGFMKLLEGAYSSIRNPKAHSLQENPDIIETAQNLVFASLLARRIDDAKVYDRTSQE